MRIVVLTSSYPRFSGDVVAPFIKSISEGLSSLGHEVIVVAPYDIEVAQTNENQETSSKSAPLLYRFRYIWPKKWHIMGHARSLQADVRLRWQTYFLLPFFLIAQFFTLLSVCRKHHIEVLYVNWVLPNGLVGALVAKMLKIPFILSLHGSDVFIVRKSSIYRKLASWIFDQAKSITACSNDLRQGAIDAGADPQKVFLLAWGADPDLFTPDLRIHQPNPGDSDGKILVFALGRLVYKKGFDVLLQAWREVIPVCYDARLLIGGDGPLYHELERTILTLELQDSVKLIGPIPWTEVPKTLANIDIFVLPSVKDKSGNMDGLPTVLLEAMSSGNAVVASNIGGVPLVIEPMVNGVLVPPSDVHALAHALLKVLGDANLRVMLGTNARRAVQERFNWGRVAQELSNLIEQSLLQKQFSK